MRIAIPAIFIVLASLLPEAVAQNSVAGQAWQAHERDSICGVSNTRQVTNPAMLDYRRALTATPEMKDLRSRKIDPASAEGQILRQRAVDHVRRASSKVMRKNGHCSIWKEISHRDGRRVPELTGQVISELSISTASLGKSAGISEAMVLAGDSAAEPGAAEEPEGGSSTAWILFVIGGALAAIHYVMRSRNPGDVPQA